MLSYERCVMYFVFTYKILFPQRAKINNGMIKLEPKANWRQVRRTLASLFIVATVFVVFISIFLIISKISKSAFSYRAELVLLLGISLNVFGSLILSTLGDMYLAWKRNQSYECHRHVGRQGESFYPDLPVKQRFRVKLTSVIFQIIFLVILNIVVFAIAKSVATSRYVFWLWFLGCLFGGCAVTMDIAAVVRLYLAHILYYQENEKRNVQGNVELLGNQAADSGLYEEANPSNDQLFSLDDGEDPF
jgi:hypothetical protein